MASRSTKFKGFNFDDFENDSDSDEEGKAPGSNGKCVINVKQGKSPFYLMQNNSYVEFDQTTKIISLKQYFMDNVPVPPDQTPYNKLEEIKFRNSKASKQGGGIMQDNDTLSKYSKSVPGINYQVVFISVTYHVHGGSKNKDDEKIDVSKMDNNTFFSMKNKARDRKRIIKKTKKFPMSKEPCCVTLEKNKNNIYMSCGHTISPEALFDVMIWAFAKYKYKYNIYCPMDKCGKKWGFKYCCAAACLNLEEYGKFEAEREQRKNPTKNCPHCGISCQRPKNLKYYRVACRCRKGDWCYECEQPWKGGGFTVCGNSACHTAEINEILKNCEQEKGVSGHKVPAIRACPACFTLIQHTKACKHMHCKSCGNYFCFVCLHVPSKHSNGKPNWECGSSNKPCNVHSRQTIK